MTHTETMRRALEPFAKIDMEYRLTLDDSMNVNVGIMNGNVTQQVIRDQLTVEDFRRAREAYNAIALPAGEQAGDGWKRRTFQLVEIINAGERLGTRINGRFILDRDRVWAFLQGDAPTTAPSPAKPDAEPADYDLLLADAKARQRGKNLDGSPRRETVPHDASAGQPADLLEIVKLAKGRCWINGRSPDSSTLCIRITEDDRQLLEIAIRALPAPGSETETGGGT